MGARARAVLAILGWTLAGLVAIDVAIGLVFRMPADPRRDPPSLVKYFDYGRSIEGKLTRMIGPDDARSAPITVAGWIGRDCIRPPKPAAPGKIGVSVYGMSFTQHVATEMARIDPRISPTTYAGPGAPLSHSVACAEEVRSHGRDPNRIRIVGLLGSSLGRLVTLGGLTTSFEAPMPFAYPRYHADAREGLRVEEPVARTPEDLHDPATRAAYLGQLARGDAFYDRWQMVADLADRSVLLRMIRRAYAQAEGRARREELVTADGHTLRPKIATVAGRLLLRFAADARADGATPVVLLLQDRGDDPDLLDRSFAPLLEQHRIRFVSSYRIAPNSEPGNFVPDGHFTPEIDRRIAERVLAEIARPTN